MATRMLQRRGTAAEWAAANPVLAAGEIGYETDTKVQKVGDGVTAWNSLTMSWVPVGGGVLLTNPISHPAPTAPAHTARLQDVRDIVAGAGLLDFQVHTASSSFVKANYPNLRGVRVRLVGGGGGGGGVVATGTAEYVSSGGGGSGGYAEDFIEESALAASTPITVGAGGARGDTSGSMGGTGGQSSFGSHVVANGGAGGLGGATKQPYSGLPYAYLCGGEGGEGVTGALNVRGERGDDSIAVGGGSFLSAGKGGNSVFAGGAYMTLANTGRDGQAGSGGGGIRNTQNNTARGGGLGGGGVVILEIYGYKYS